MDDQGSFDDFFRNAARTSEPALRHGRVAWPVGHTLASGRFQVLRQLGRGGMGVVYEAFDAERRSRVALKMLIQVDPTSIYRLKTEFRTLSELIHSNLVRLHEMFCDEEHWFFTMDLVRGQTFDCYVRPDGVLDSGRLAGSFAQLLRAVTAIHHAGKAHRDLKPSNVLVGGGGKLVVLDFGLAADPNPGGVGNTITAECVTGTPAYMAPEQAAGHDAGSAADIYAVGAMLFESLTGRLPFGGHPGEMLAAKQRDAPPRPGDLVPDLSGPLSDLCVAMLARDPLQRPNIGIVSSLAGELLGEAEQPEAARDDTAMQPHVLRGRDIELGTLRDAYLTASRGHAVAAFVKGASGMGKSVLCETFLASIPDPESAVVLRGRCRERESLPFKALDCVLDALGRYLRRLPGEQAAQLMPRDVFALARLFPTLGRVRVIAQAPTLAVFDQHDLKRRAFAALSELLTRIRDHHPLVIYVDDCQWADADSLAFLHKMLTDRTPLPCLLLLAHRADDEPEPDWLSEVRKAVRANPEWQIVSLPLLPLGATAARDLAHDLLADGPAGATELAGDVALASGGSPFFTAEFARYVKRTGSTPSTLSLADVLNAHFSSLTDSARRVLSLLALVGQPLEANLLLDATDSDHTDLDALHELHLVRVSANGGRHWECYHDRIRETLCSMLPPEEIREHFQTLVRTLRGRSYADLELSSRCFEGAGDYESAARFCALAAEQAADSLAFDHAASLYLRALELFDWSPEKRADLGQSLGAALENAGRCIEASQAYQAAAALSVGGPRLELLRRATEQLVATGHVMEGTALARTLCLELDVPMPESVASAVASLTLSELRLRTRRQRDSPPERPVAPRTTLRLRTCETVLKGLIGRLPIHTACVSAKYLEMALANGAGEDRVRALGFNAYVHSLINAQGRRPRDLLARMDALARADGRSEVLGFACLMKGTAAYHWEDFRAARRELATTLTHLQGCRGVAWEIDAAHVYDQLSAHHAGDFADLARTAPMLAQEAAARGRVWAFAMLSGFSAAPAWLVPDDPEGYRHNLAEAKRRWPALPEPQWPDYVLLTGEAMVSVYEGRARVAMATMDAARKAYARSMLTKGAGTAHAGYALHRGRCAASAVRELGHAGGTERRALIELTARCIDVLSKHETPRANGMGEVFRAALALDSRRTEQAMVHLRSGLRSFEISGARMHASATRLRLGALEGGEGGRALQVEGEKNMHAQGVRNLDAMAEVFCPGCRPL